MSPSIETPLAELHDALRRGATSRTERAAVAFLIERANPETLRDHAHLVGTVAHLDWNLVAEGDDDVDSREAHLLMAAATIAVPGVAVALHDVFVGISDLDRQAFTRALYKAFDTYPVATATEELPPGEGVATGGDGDTFNVSDLPWPLGTAGG